MFRIGAAFGVSVSITGASVEGPEFVCAFIERSLSFRKIRTDTTISFLTKQVCPFLLAEILHQVRTGRGNKSFLRNRGNGRDIPDPDHFAGYGEQLRAIRGEGHTVHPVTVRNAG